MGGGGDKAVANAAAMVYPQSLFDVMKQLEEEQDE